MENLKRKDIFKINPLDILVNFEDNPRADYGTEEDWGTLKESIRQEGVKEPVRIFQNNKEDGWSLAHGFRRVRAVLELIEEGEDIKEILAFKVTNNPETILLDHLSLNSGKPLNDVERSNIVLRLENFGYDPKEIARKTGMQLQKVYVLLRFAKEAKKELKDAVINGEMKFTTAMEVLRASIDHDQQNEILEKAREKKESEGSEIIKGKDITEDSEKAKKEKRPSFKDLMFGYIDWLEENAEEDEKDISDTIVVLRRTLKFIDEGYDYKDVKEMSFVFKEEGVS